MRRGPARLVLLGAPGSGKGTQGAALASRLGLPYLSSGALLRRQAAAGTELGREAAGYLDRGDLVPDELVVALLRGALNARPSSGGYVLEGFPRTRAQAEELEALAPPDAAIFLAVPDEVARGRLERRAGQGRSDDAHREVVEHRLARFHDTAKPLLDFYRKRGILVDVDADAPPEAVTAAIARALGAGSRPSLG